MDSTSALVRNISRVISQDDEYTPLQKHAAFFDRNNDGIIYPWETFQGCRAIGCGYALSTFAAIFFNGGLSSRTRPGKLPNPLLPIEIKNIHLGKHGSDTDAYDNEGRFVPSKFEEIFKKHAHTYADALTADELNELLKANREPKDFAGWIAAQFEWKTLNLLAKDENGLLHKDRVRAIFDGTLFQQLEKENSASKKKIYAL